MDQVFTKEDEKPVALFTHVVEEEAKRMGVVGGVGPTEIRGKGKYERDRKYITRAL